MSKIVKTVKTESEFENVIDSYVANGFRLKSRTDKEAELVKTTKGKKYKFFTLVGFVGAFVTLFIAPIVYNKLHSKTQKVVITLNK